HAASAVHGSVYWKLLDDSAFFAVNSIVETFFVLTASFTIYLTKPVSSGELIAEGKMVNKTGKQFIAESVLFTDSGEEIARGSGVYLKSKIKMTPEMGYK
ncbi:MAG: PaaI family thioesterase, partial [Candidatus Hodarchaeales archaeon]